MGKTAGCAKIPGNLLRRQQTNKIFHILRRPSPNYPFYSISKAANQVEIVRISSSRCQRCAITATRSQWASVPFPNRHGPQTAIKILDSSVNYSPDGPRVPSAFRHDDYQCLSVHVILISGNLRHAWESAWMNVSGFEISSDSSDSPGSYAMR